MLKISTYEFWFPRNCASRDSRFKKMCLEPCSNAKAMLPIGGNATEHAALAAHFKDSPGHATERALFASGPKDPRLEKMFRWAELINKECWDVILHYLPVSPQQRANGIAVASRIMNVRWRKYHLPIIREMVLASKRASIGTEVHLQLCDLGDITL